PISDQHELAEPPRRPYAEPLLARHLVHAPSPRLLVQPHAVRVGEVLAAPLALAPRIRLRPLPAPLGACRWVALEALRSLDLVRAPPGACVLGCVRDGVDAAGLAVRELAEFGGDLLAERRALVLGIDHRAHHDCRSTAIASRAASVDISRPSSSSQPPLATLARRRRTCARPRARPRERLLCARALSPPSHHDCCSTAIASRAALVDMSRPSSSSQPPLATLARRRSTCARPRARP